VSVICSRCGMPVREGFKFCNVCGTNVSGEVSAIKNAEEAVPYTKLAGLEGSVVRAMTGTAAGQFRAVYPECTFGRLEGDYHDAGDTTLSMQHAQIRCTDDSIVINDLGSLNGVFLRIRDKVILRNGDIIRAGNHYFLYDHYENAPFREEFNTEFYATPNRGERFRLVEVLRHGLRGRACTAPDGGIIVGRSEGDFLFPHDDTMNAKHFSIRWTQRGGILLDHRSTNGTFVQIHEPTILEHSDQFFVGQTLFHLL